MKIRPSFAATALALITLLVSGTLARSAELKVLSAAGMRPVVEDLQPRFEHATGRKLALSFATIGAITKRIHDGDAPDVVITSPSAIEDLIKQGKARTGTVTVIAHSGLGVAVRKGQPKPDISTPEAFKRALLSAKAITYPNPAGGGASGVYFATLLERLGIAAEIKSKTIFPKAGPSPLLVVKGEAELAINQIQELAAVPGLDVVGPFPKDLQHMTVFSAAVMTTAASLEVPMQLIRFLGSPDAVAVIKTKGLEPGAP